MALRDLEWIRHQKAQRLQDRLQDPDLRARIAASSATLLATPPMPSLRSSSDSALVCADDGADSVDGGSRPSTAGGEGASVRSGPSSRSGACSNGARVGAVSGAPTRRRHPAVPPLPLQAAGLSPGRGPSHQGPAPRENNRRLSTGGTPHQSPEPQPRACANRPARQSTGGIGVRQQQASTRQGGCASTQGTGCTTAGPGLRTRSAERSQNPPSYMAPTRGATVRRQGQPASATGSTYASNSGKPSQARPATDRAKPVPKSSGARKAPQHENRVPSRPSPIDGGDQATFSVERVNEKSLFEAKSALNASMVSLVPGLTVGEEFKENGRDANLMLRSDVDLARISDNLQEAAIALRRILPTSSMCSTAASTAQAARPPVLDASEEVWTCSDDRPFSGPCSPSLPSVLLGGSVSPVSGFAGTNVTPEKDTDVQRLMLENATLREAYSDANRRLAELEEEKNRFFDEGIYDVVNSVCGQSSVYPKGGSRSSSMSVSLPVGNPALGGGRLSLDSVHSVASVIEQVSPTAVDPSGPVQLSPAWAAAAEARRAEEERRSAELVRENAQLRRELTRHGEVGEVTEHQLQAAEDRMHELEQEAGMLRKRIAHLSAAGASPLVAAIYAENSTVTGGTEPNLSDFHAHLLSAASQQEQDTVRVANIDSDSGIVISTSADVSVYRPLVDVAEIAAAETTAARSQTENEELAEKVREELREEMLVQSQSRERLIGDLDAQTQVLETRLRATEARAIHLEEENARLQAQSPREIRPETVSPHDCQTNNRFGAESPQEASRLDSTGTGFELEVAEAKFEPLDLEEAW